MVAPKARVTPNPPKTGENVGLIRFAKNYLLFVFQ